jgi:hypothetical protein
MEASRQPQHLRALDRANETRLARAKVKRQVAAGEKSAADVLRDPSWCVATWQIVDLLMAQRRWGRARARRLLLSLGLPEQKQIGTMTERQRKALIAVLDPPQTAQDVLASVGLS